MSNKITTERGPRAGKYLNFHLGSECYGISVTDISEIIRLCPITEMPKMPQYFLGVINLRGKIIPVIDLAKRLDLSKEEDLERACIIVVNAQNNEQEKQLVGLQVDMVDEVVAINEDSMEAPPDFCDSISGHFIQAMAKVKDAVVTILDIEEILSNTKNLEHKEEESHQETSAV